MMFGVLRKILSFGKESCEDGCDMCIEDRGKEHKDVVESIVIEFDRIILRRDWRWLYLSLSDEEIRNLRLLRWEFCSGGNGSRVIISIVENDGVVMEDVMVKIGIKV